MQDWLQKVHFLLVVSAIWRESQRPDGEMSIREHLVLAVQ